MRFLDIETLKGMLNKVIVCNKKVDDHEAYAENGMRGRVVKVFFDSSSTDPDEAVHKITLDFSEFEEHNKLLESSNYYDKDGKPTRTAREAGFYTVKEEYYINPRMSQFPFEVDLKLTEEANLLREQNTGLRTTTIEECAAIAREMGSPAIADAIRNLLTQNAVPVVEDTEEVSAPSPR